MMTVYELQLQSGKTVTWAGRSGEDAAKRYANAHPGATVIAWRMAERIGVFAGMLPIQEPIR